jgi:hypothetical protein
MTKDEALDLALEALKAIIHWYGVRDKNDVMMPPLNQNPEIKESMDAITAIKQARSAPVQEPVAWTDEQLQMLNFLYGSGEWDGLWFDQKHPKKKGAFWWRSDLRRLFATPPAAKRQWVSLTDEELKAVTRLEGANSRAQLDLGKAFWAGARWAEAQSKEKNT